MAVRLYISNDLFMGIGFVLTRKAQSLYTLGWGEMAH